MTEFTKYVLSDIPYSVRDIFKDELFITIRPMNGQQSTIYVTDKRFTCPRKLGDNKSESVFYIINETPIYTHD